MGYYVDQLAEQDRQKRLADLMTAGEAGSFPAFMPQPDYSGERGMGNYPAPMHGPQPLSMDYGGGERTMGNYPAPDYRDARDLGAMSTGGGLPYQPQTKLSDLSPTEMARAEQINAQLNDPAYWGQTGTEVLPQQEQQQQPPLSYIRKGPANSFTEKDDRQWLADATAAGAFQGKNLPAGYIPRQAGDYQSAGAGASGGGQSSELLKMQKEAIDNLMRPVIGAYGRTDEAATMANRQKAFTILQSIEKDRMSSAETKLKSDKLTAEIANLRGGPERDRLAAEKTRAEIAQLQAKPQQLSDIGKYVAKEAAITAAKEARAKANAGIPGTPEYKRVKDFEAKHVNAQKSKEMFDRHADAYIKNIDDIIGADDGEGMGGASKSEHAGLRGAVGNLDSKLPDLFSTQKQVDARRLGEGLLNKASVKGLTEVRESGTAPGSITEKEWPIFQTQEEIMAMSQSEDQYRKNLRAQRQLIREGKARVAKNWETAQANFEGLGNPVKNTASSPAASGAAAQVISMAKDAISQGKSREAVAKMLQSMGVDPKEAGL